MLFIGLLFVLAVGQELTNFTYVEHGKDWDASFCRKDGHQSPVMLKKSAKKIDSYLFTDFKPANATIKFYNTTFHISSESFGSVYFVNMFGKSLGMNAFQMRVRCKSEHEVQHVTDGPSVKYDLELQIFHKLIYQTENQRLAIAIFFREGTEADPNLQAIIDAHNSNSTNIQLDLTRYFKLLNSYKYWSYKGSITMPRCTDNNINWVVIDNPFEMSKQQNEFFMGQFYGNRQPDGNWRELQENSNEVGYYDSA